MPLDHKKLKAMRLRQGMSGREFATKVGIDPSHLCHMEAGRKTAHMELRMVERLARALGVGVEEILKKVG